MAEESHLLGLTSSQRKRTVAPFLSSTFSDFSEEREHLAQVVFPRFELICQEHGVFFHPTDLRWGITKEQSSEGKVIELCLDAVDSGRPFFIGFLGGRYGWCHSTDPRSESYQLTLEGAKARYPWVAQYEDRSITELEILHGFLRDVEAGVPVDLRWTTMYMRKAKDHHERDGTPVAAERLADLKARIRASPVEVTDYETPQELGQHVLKDLRRMLDNIVSFSANTGGGGTSSGSVHGFYSRKMMEHWDVDLDTDRPSGCFKEAFADFSRHFGYEPTKRKHALGTPLLISGVTGCGKSTVAAALSEWGGIKLRKQAAARQQQPLCVVTYHVGSTALSTSYHAFLRTLLSQLKATFGFQKALPEENEQLAKALPEWMQLSAAAGYTLVIIDGADRFDAHDLSWFAEPPMQADGWAEKMAVLCRFQVVVTVTDGTDSHQALMTRNWSSIQLNALTHAHKLQMARTFCKGFNKELSHEQLERIASAAQSELPLYLRAVLEELLQVGQFEKLDQRIDELMKCKTVVEVYTHKIRRLEQMGATAQDVQEVLCFLCVSRGGISASELAELPSLKKSLAQKEEWTRLHLAIKGCLISRDSGLLDLADPMMREAVRQAFLVKKEMDYRKQLARFLSEKYSPSQPRYTEVAYQYNKAGNYEKLLDCITEPAAFALFQEQRHQQDFMRYCRQLNAPGTADFETVLLKLIERLDLGGEDSQSPRNVTPASSNSMFLIAQFAINSAQYKHAETLLLSCIGADRANQTAGEEAGDASTSPPTVLARDLLALATLYIRHSKKLTLASGQLPLVEGRRFLDEAKAICGAEYHEGMMGMETASLLAGVYHLFGLLGLIEHKGAASRSSNNHLQEALSCAETADKIWSESIGDDSRCRAETLNLIGSLYQERGLVTGEHALMDVAEKHLQESLSIRKRVCSRGDKTLGQSENTLGDFFLLQDHLELATEHYDRAREHYVEAFGPKGPSGFYPVRGLAKVEARREFKDYDKICGLWETVVELLEPLGEDKTDYQEASRELLKCIAERDEVDTSAGTIQRAWRRSMQDSTTEIGAVPEPTVDASSVPASTVVEVMEVLQQQSQQLSQMHALLEQQALKI